EADRVHRQAGDDVDDHQPPADELVRHDRLQEHGQHRQQDPVDAQRQNVPEQVLVELEVGVALDRLHRDSGSDADQQGGDQYQRDREGLGHDEGPVRHGGGVDDLVRATLAFAPDQLAGVIDGDDDRDQAERSLEGGDGHPRHQLDRRAVELAGVPEPGHRIDQAQ